MTRLVEVSLKHKDIERYRRFNPAIYKRLVRTAKKHKNQRIIHVNATARGGGVAEMLRSQVALEKSLGLKSHWLVIQDAPPEFFVVTKKIHNLLQGKAGFLTEKEKRIYRNTNQKIGKSLRQFLKHFKSGVVIIHDPQPLMAIDSLPSNFQQILRLHIDLSAPNPQIIEFLRPFITRYSLTILSSEEYLKSLPWLKKQKARIIMPAIDPLSQKNRALKLEIAKMIIKEFGINPAKPIVTQVSRFDPWKDPLGVIKSYYIAKRKIPDLQLVLVGFLLATDDPEAVSVFKNIQKHARGSKDIYLFSNPRALEKFSNDIFVNALYTASDIIIQKSLREGFGLTITEAMWKEKPVIAGMTTGALAQIKNRKNGIIVSSPEKAAKAIIQLMKNKKMRRKQGEAARRSVKQKFLLVRYILDHLRLYSVKSEPNNKKSA